MLELNQKNARMFSMLGQRGSIFGIALPDIADNMENLRILTADLTFLSGLGTFKNKHPDKILNLGIAEQNMLGVAAGLAKEGNCVFTTTYATFLTMRSFEQIRNNMGYMGFNIKAIGSSAGFAMGMSGNTHYAIEDIALMRAIPNIIVLSPADAGEAFKMSYAITKINNPVYLRLTGGINCPIVYKEEYDFEIGRAVTLRNGQDIAIIATGTMVNESLKAADILAEKQIQATVINMHTIKPLDTKALDEVFNNHKIVVTVEEHNIIGGLGSAIAEYKASLSNWTKLFMIGIPDVFCQPAEHLFLMEKYGLTAKTISEKIIDLC